MTLLHKLVVALAVWSCDYCETNNADDRVSCRNCGGQP